MRNKILAFFILLVLFACHEYGSLDDWMKAEKVQAQINYKRNYKAPDYTSHQLRHDYNLDKLSPIQPFSPLKMRLSYFPGAGQVKGILEYFDLNEIKYVGYLKNSLGIKVFINVGDKVSPVVHGTTIGSNYSRVINITPKKIVVRENLEDSEGLWITKDSEIELYQDN